MGVTYTSPEASGITDLTVTGVASVEGVVVNFGPNSFTIAVQIDRLQAASVAGLQVDTASNMHDSNNGNAAQATVDALGDMAQGFANGCSKASQYRSCV